MSRRKPPPWTQQERAILAEVYPREGVNGAADALPDRSWQAIHQMAHKMGIKCELVTNAPKPKLQGKNLAEAVRLREVEKWSFARIGATFGVSEAGACNAVTIELCVRSGHRPAKRDAHGRMLPEEIERLRFMLRKGLKGIDIQLRMGISAGRVAEERRRYNRELKERGKVLLPPPGGGQAYSGVRVSRAKRAEVEALYLRGLGARKIHLQTGVSHTSIVRIRERLVKRLARKGEALPGCDKQGVRRVIQESSRYVPPASIDALRQLLLERVPVRAAALRIGIGSSTAYKMRDKFAAELAERGEELPKPILPGRVKGAGTQSWLPQAWMPRHRELIGQVGLDEATAQVRREIAAARRAENDRKKTFEEQLAAVRAGSSTVSKAFVPKVAGPAGTLGGIATGMLA